MPSADLIHGTLLRGDATQLDLAAATRLGRAFGTLLRRRTGGGAKVVVLARGGDGAELPLRDGLVRGLLLTGHEVRDLGVADADLVGFAVEHQGAAGAALVLPAEGSARSLRFSLGTRPLAAELLTELATLADGDDFAAGTGTLALVDLHAAFRSAGAAG